MKVRKVRKVRNEGAEGSEGAESTENLECLYPARDLPVETFQIPDSRLNEK
jgi:hypothetical protein